jgi:ribosomal protein S12 methylthiotransferase accessory factor
MIAATLPPEIARLIELVSPRTGVVRNLMKLPRSVDEPVPPILYQAALSNFDFKKVQSSERSAAGKGLTEAEAMGGAIGEAVERYCSAHVEPERIRRARLDQLGEPHITPQECVLYSDRQYAGSDLAYPRPAADVEVGWVTGRELPAHQDVLVPASLVFLYGAGAGGPDFFCPPTSNGLAAGPDLASAIVSGLCELVERDAFLITWMNRLPAPAIDLRALGGVARSIHDHYARFGFETHVFDVTTDVPIPAMMAVSVDRSGRTPAAVVGLGCHLNPEVAVLKALFEICQVRPGETRRSDEARQRGKTLASYRDVKTLDDHSGFFAPLPRLSEFAFLLQNAGPRPLDAGRNLDRGNAQRNLEVVVDALTRVGCRVAFVDLTTADVAPYGIRVVRTLATGLQPIHFGYGEERLGGRRLYEVPQRLGHAAAIRTEADLNPCPHPIA